MVSTATVRERHYTVSSPMGPEPLAYLITFRTYGTWLHGDARGSVDRDHNIPGTPMLDPNRKREIRERSRLKRPPVVLSTAQRAVVRTTIAQVAERRDWTVHALEVRSNHVHVVVGAPETPERVMNDLKTWCTRRLVEANLLARGTKVWSRHGSTKYLWKPPEVETACRYVCEGQGAEP